MLRNTQILDREPPECMECMVDRFEIEAQPGVCLNVMSATNRYGRRRCECSPGAKIDVTEVKEPLSILKG